MEVGGIQLKYGFLNNYALLVHRLFTTSILPHVFSEGIISQNEREKIAGQYGEGSKTEVLLDIIHRQGVADPAVYIKFFTLLSDDESITSGQNLEEVLKKIQDDSKLEEVRKKFQYETKSLEESDRLTLDKHKSIIMQTLSVENILPELVSSGAVSCASKGKIMAEKSQDDQASSLLQVICNGGSPSVEIFIAVLEESDQYKALGETLRMDRETLAKGSDKLRRKQRTVIDHSLLLEDLKEIYSGWDSFGVNLGIPYAKLKEFKQNVTGMDGLVDYCLKLVIEAWILGDKENVNREFLIRAIEAVGGYARVIAEIQKQDFPIKMKNFAKILKSIRPLKHRYSTLGIQLGVDLNEIKKFERQQGNAERCLSEVLSYWLNEGEDAPDKQTLWDALEEVGNKGLAQQLKEEYKGIDFPK